MFRFCSRSLRQYSVKNFSSRFHYISPARVNHLKTIKSDFNQSALTSKYFYHTSRVLKNKDDEISNKKCQHCGKASMDKLTKGFYVCNQCSNIVQIDPAEQEKEDNLVKERIQYTETLSKRLYDHLDQIVVGQEKAKKTLCIAATTHYQNAFGTLKKKRTYPEQQIITVGNKTFRLPPVCGKRVELANEFDDPAEAVRYAESIKQKVDETSTESTNEASEVEAEPDTGLGKANIMLIGHTGSGKTLLVESAAAFLDVPVARVDCTTLTAAGYVGADAESCLYSLLTRAKGDQELAEKGIIYLDEIDKIASHDKVSLTKDVGGECVQQALLKLLEGSEVKIKKDKIPGAKLPGNGELIFDTSKVLFIGSGAFPHLAYGNEANGSTNILGFGTEKIEVEDVQEDVTPEKLIKYGMIPEFVGRFPIQVRMEDLSQDHMLRILTEPKDSYLKQYIDWFAKHDVRLAFTQDSLVEICKEAMKLKTGARGLKSVLENLLTDARFGASNSEFACIIVDAEVVLKKKPVILLSKEELDQTSKTSECSATGN